MPAVLKIKSSQEGLALRAITVGLDFRKMRLPLREDHFLATEFQLGRDIVCSYLREVFFLFLKIN